MSTFCAEYENYYGLRYPIRELVEPQDSMEAGQ